MVNKIKLAFEKQYTGKPVPKEWQSKYGKKYSKDEADEVFYAWENRFKGGKK
jgi:HEPN domain-containing protein